MSEWQSQAPPSQYGTLDHPAAKIALADFVEHVKSLPPAPTALEANQVQVYPGAAMFTTITAALKSITDASLKKEYTIYVGPGVYQESVVCKPFVYIEGSGADNTSIVSAAGVTGASNSSLGSVTINGGLSAITCVGAVNFAVSNSSILGSDVFAPGRLGGAIGVQIDFSAGSDTPSSVSISYSTIQAQVQNPLSWPAGVIAASNSVVVLNYCSNISVHNGSNGVACGASTAAEVQLYDCTLNSPVWALELHDDTATMIATACTTNGKVSPGVVIKPGSPRSEPPVEPPPHGPPPRELI